MTKPLTTQALLLDWESRVQHLSPEDRRDAELNLIGRLICEIRNGPIVLGEMDEAIESLGRRAGAA